MKGRVCVPKSVPVTKIADDPVADDVMDAAQVRQADLALALEDFVDVIAARLTVLMYHSATSRMPLGCLSHGAGHQRDIAKGRAAEVGQDGPVGLGVEPLGFGGEIRQVVVRDRAEFLQVVLRRRAYRRRSAAGG